MEQVEKKIDDVSYAIDQIDTVINNLKEYKEYKDICSDLECEKSVLELDLEELEKEYEELLEREIKEAKNENRELERQYWREVI